MLFVTGLGLDPSKMALIRSTTTYQPGGTAPAVSTGGAPGYTINQHTHYQIFHELFPINDFCSAPGTSPVTCVRHINVADAGKYADEWRAKVRAAAAASGMPQCPAGAVTDNGGSCYYGRAAMGSYMEEADGSISLLPPGTFHTYGVIFGAPEYINGRFSKSFKPNATQRKQLEWAVIYRSAERILGLKASRALAPFGGKVSSEGNPSVDQVMARVPEIALYWVNFDRNPIQPTPTERTQPGGWAAWIAKGGYPLSRDVLTGKASLSGNALGIEFCSSILCQCPTKQGTEPGTGRAITIGGFPSCVPMGFSGEGAAAGSSFWPFLSVHQTVGDPTFDFTLMHDDKSWIEQLGVSLQSWMDKIVGGACDAKAKANPYAAAMCALWGVGKALQAKEGGTPVSAMPPPEPKETITVPEGQTVGPPTVPLPVPANQRYTGCVARYNTTRKVFSIYCPPGTPAAGFGFDIFGAFGADSVTPPVPTDPVTGTPLIKIAETTTLPQQGEKQINSEKDKFFRLKNPFMWAAIAGTVAAAGTGGYMIYRRRR